MYIICDRPREKGPFDAEIFFSLYAGLCKYEAMTTFAENLKPIGLTVTTVFIRGLQKSTRPQTAVSMWEPSKRHSGSYEHFLEL